MMKKLSKGLEDAKVEKERLVEEKENLRLVFKETEEKAFKLQEDFKSVKQVFPPTSHKHSIK